MAACVALLTVHCVSSPRAIFPLPAGRLRWTGAAPASQSNCSAERAQPEGACCLLCVLSTNAASLGTRPLHLCRLVDVAVTSLQTRPCFQLRALDLRC